MQHTITRRSPSPKHTWFKVVFTDLSCILAMSEMATCANPGCTEPGTKQCSACKTTPYCGPICQTADWLHHKESCPGHLRKVGMAHFEKAKGFNRARNFAQSLRNSELALTKLKQLKDRSLGVIEILDVAMDTKFHALNIMGRAKEALEIATERYNMWATNFMRNPGMIWAAFPLIDSLLRNNEFVQAHLIASTVYEMTMHPTNNDIPGDLQQPYLAQAACHLARATAELAQSGAISPEEKQKAGKEAIALARKALEIHTQLYNDEGVVQYLGVLANVLNCFNDSDDDEAIHLYEQVIAIYSRLEGSSSVNVALNIENLGSAYLYRVNRAQNANDLDRQLANLELALPHYREAIEPTITWTRLTMLHRQSPKSRSNYGRPASKLLLEQQQQKQQQQRRRLEVKQGVISRATMCHQDCRTMALTFEK